MWEVSPADSCASERNDGHGAVSEQADVQSIILFLSPLGKELKMYLL